MTVLSVVGIVSKIIGALHRIPLAWLIGDTGMGVYQLIFPTYNMLLAISSAGLPGGDQPNGELFAGPGGSPQRQTHLSLPCASWSALA